MVRKEAGICMVSGRFGLIALQIALVLTIVQMFPKTASAQVLAADRWANMYSIVPRGYVCYRAEKPIVIDGRIDDPSWRYAPWTEYFIDIEGDVKPRPRFRTQAKMLWDDTYFYVIADMQEPHVWGTLTYHDAIIYNDNDFEIFMDPNSDNCEYYEMEINALNAEWDLFLRHTDHDKYPDASDWEIPGLKTAVHVNGTLNDFTDIDRGWSVEFAIPWAVLGEYAHKAAPPKDGDQWRLNFSRVEWRHELIDGFYRRVKGWREDNWVWSPQGVINMHSPEKWGYVQFTTGKPGTVQYRPDPTEPSRMLLNGIYWAQEDNKRIHGRFTGSIEDLAVHFYHHDSIVLPPKIELTGDGYRASVNVKMPDGSQKTLSIGQDSRVIVK